MWRNNCAIASFYDYFAGSVNVGDDGGEAHCAGFDDHIRETLPIAREYECVSCGKPGSDIGLLPYGFDGCARIDVSYGFFRKRIKLGFIVADENKPYGGLLFVEAAESSDKLVDAFVAHEAAYENECEKVVATYGCGMLADIG